MGALPLLHSCPQAVADNTMAPENAAATAPALSTGAVVGIAVGAAAGAAAVVAAILFFVLRRRRSRINSLRGALRSSDLGHGGGRGPDDGRGKDASSLLAGGQTTDIEQPADARRGGGGGAIGGGYGKDAGLRTGLLQVRPCRLCGTCW